jgi:hypothetical protein
MNSLLVETISIGWSLRQSTGRLKEEQHGTHARLCIASAGSHYQIRVRRTTHIAVYKKQI